MKRDVLIFLTYMCAAFMFVLHEASSADDYVPTPANPSFKTIQRDEVLKALENIHSSPRLLLTDEAIQATRQKIETDPRMDAYYNALKDDADKLMTSAPVEYQLTGKRLLSVSRQALKRIFAWSFLYRYTGDEKYSKRVEQEVLAISNFSDWHPAHFLDVAEMTVAVAIGYDSCKDTFSEENRSTVRDAIYVKGVLSVRNLKDAWKRNTANWNQVCWCGNLFGALAIYDEERDEEEWGILVDAILDSVNGVTWGMSSYEPDGNYTEGPVYWGYGTGFNILLFGALESAFGSDFGLSDAPGFLKSIQYYEHVFGTTGEAFNYPDAAPGKFFEATAFWYSCKLKDPNVVWNENNAMNSAYLLKNGKLKNPKGVLSFRSLIGDRVATCALLWGPTLDKETCDSLLNNPEFQDSLARKNAPSELGYVGLGNHRCCVALFRTAWSPDAAYLGIKCGYPNAPHGHLDEGSFVYDDLGVRWIVELGPEDYHKIESRGMNLWNTAQNSDRWKLLRYNNFGHSVPTINGNLQQADQKTFFVETQIGGEGEKSSATIDLTLVYKNDVAKAFRKATLLPNGDLIIEDSFEALPDKEASIERRFLTPAHVEIAEEGLAVLTQADRNNTGVELKKYVKTQSDVPTSFKTAPCESDNDFDAPNPGITILIEQSRLAPGEKAVFTTTFSSAK